MFIVCRPCLLKMAKVWDKELKMTEQMGIEAEWNAVDLDCDYKKLQDDECLNVWHELFLAAAKRGSKKKKAKA